MVNTIISVDVKKSSNDQPFKLHNRWHPDIPPLVTVNEGEVFRVECLDSTGGQIKNNDDARDILEVDPTCIHYLSGPIGVVGAEVGDVLEVEILEVGPLAGDEWGYTGIFDKNNSGGFLSELYPNAVKVIWDIEGIYASSRHIPGVRFPGIVHPGIIGTAPSHEILKQWNKREKELIDSNKNSKSLIALPPNPIGALVGKLEGTPQGEKVKAEGARTIPPRENGGNCDIKNLSHGSKVWLPVYVPGGNLSVGDLHFSQGDGEISFCGGIEMSGGITLKIRVIKNGIEKFSLKNPIFLPGIVEPRYTKYLTFQGINVNGNKQHFLDATIAYRQACINCIEYFKRFGYTGEQIYTLLSACPCEGRINSIVDIPNACCSIAVPTEIFDFDVCPTNQKVKKSTPWRCC